MSRKQRLLLCRRLGKSRLASLHREHYLKRAGVACLIKAVGEGLALDSSGSGNGGGDGEYTHTPHQGEQQEEEKREGAWETLYDENYDAYYYHNTVTGETRWRTEPQDAAGSGQVEAATQQESTG
jgi:hypothetical protein